MSSNDVGAGQPRKTVKGADLHWVGVKERSLSYYIGETILINLYIYIHTHSGYLNQVPQQQHSSVRVQSGH